MMVAPVDDECFRDIGPHFVERADAALREQAEDSERYEALAELLDNILTSVPTLKEKDKRKHDAQCWEKHVECLAKHIQDAIREGV